VTRYSRRRKEKKKKMMMIVHKACWVSCSRPIRPLKAGELVFAEEPMALVVFSHYADEACLCCGEGQTVPVPYYTRPAITAIAFMMMMMFSVVYSSIDKPQH